MIRNVVLPIIVCSLLLIVQACSSGHEDEVEPVVEEKGFTVKVFYINEAQPDVEIPDAGAKVYLYYGVNNGELVRGEFQAGGEVVKGDITFFPDQMYRIDGDGMIDITPLYEDKEMTMLIESNFYTTRLAAGYFRDLSRPIVSMGIAGLIGRGTVGE